MAYTKVEYNPVNWKNKSEGLITPLDKRNLNNMDGAIKTLADSLDVAYNELDTKKLSVDGSYKIISETPTWDEKTGILRFKFYDGTEFMVDFNVEKIPVSFSMNEKGVITMTTEDGTKWTADIGSLTPNYVYDDNERIAVTTSKAEDGSTHVSFDLKKGSITNDYLANDYLASIIAETVKAQTASSDAKKSADSASESASNASTSETNAKKLADSASTSASSASTSAGNASESETNAKKYYEQTKSISESFAGTLRPKGTVTFANLPSVSLAETGDMYNVSDEFTTTTDFAEGAGNTIPLGSNVYKNSDGKWDVLAGSPVTGVKGSAETAYRRGNVNITKENIGLGNVDNTADSEKRVSYATSAGSADSATKASNDSANQKITSTYIKGVGIKNHTVTVTKGDGTSSSFEVPDTDTNTTYSLKKTGSKIQLVGSDGSTTEVTDDNTTYDLDAMINALPVGTDDPVDNDYYVSQNVDGGTSNTGYFRRPVSKLWNYIKTKLATVATSGSYTDLSNKPTIGNGKVTVNQNGTTKGTFTMNQTGDTIINLTDSDTNTWRDVVDSLDSTRTDASLSANQGRVLNDKFASYLPLSGGDMTGDITFNGHGASTIGSGSQDGAGLDAKNNLNIASWYGVSFTSKCAGFAYSDKPGVSIDCRNGTLAVAGAIYANGGVVGDLTGNAKTATTANSANSAKYINYSINKYVTGDSMKTPYWRFATIEVSSDWYDQSVILLVNTGCVGGGFGIIKLSVRSNQISNTENAYCEFSWLVRRGFDPNQFIVKGYSASKTTNYFDIYFKATGVYQGITVTVLSSGSRGNISFDWKLTNDEPRAAMDLRTYNYELVSSDEGVVDYASTANHLYNIDGSNTKHPMTFNWRGKDGQPTWLWGGEDGSNMYVYNPSNFSVNYANSAGSANSVAWGNVSGRPTALSSFTNDKGYITGITKAMVTGALGYTPPTSDTNTTYSASTGLNLSGTSFSVKYGSTEGTACQGNDSRLSNSRPASDVYAWAKASSKPSYSWSEIGGRPTTLSSFTNDSGFITGISKSSVTDALGYIPARIRSTTYNGTMGTSAGDGGRIGTARFTIPNDKSGKSVRIIHLESNYSLTTCSSPSTSGTTVTVNVHSDTITSGNPSFGGRVLYVIEGEF